MYMREKARGKSCTQKRKRKRKGSLTHRKWEGSLAHCIVLWLSITYTRQEPCIRERKRETSLHKDTHTRARTRCVTYFPERKRETSLYKDLMRKRKREGSLLHPKREGSLTHESMPHCCVCYASLSCMIKLQVSFADDDDCFYYFQKYFSTLVWGSMKFKFMGIWVVGF